MAAGNSVYDEIREQQRKLKGKPFKEKWAYFWEYYRIPTLVTVCVIAMVVSLIHTIVTQKDAALNVIPVNTYLSVDLDTEALAADFAAYAQIDTEEYNVVIEQTMSVDYEGLGDEYTYANIQKLAAMAASQSMDVVLADEDYIDHNLEGGLFVDLHEFFTEEELAAYEDRLLYRDIPEDEAGEVPVAIDVRDSQYMASAELPAYFCICSNSLNVDHAKLFLEYMLQ